MRSTVRVPRVSQLALLVLLTIGEMTPGSYVWALDREEALAVLQSSAYFPLYREIELPIGSNLDLKKLVTNALAIDEQLGKDLNTGYACAQKLGYLQIQPTGLTKYSVTVAPLGASHGRTVDKAGYGLVYLFQAYEQNPKRITGIKTLDASNAFVEFDYGATEVLDGGRCMWRDIVEKMDQIEHKGKANLGKYDDGWRVEKMQVEGEFKAWVDLKPSGAAASSKQTKGNSVGSNQSPGYKNCISLGTPPESCALLYPSSSQLQENTD